MEKLENSQENTIKSLLLRDGARSENLGGQVVMRRAAAARRRLRFEVFKFRNWLLDPVSKI